MKLSGVVLTACGISGLVYGGFDYTQGTHEARTATLELPLTDDEAVDPIWAGIGAIMVGGILLRAPKQS
jgi:TRAP-type C4-dicarboxylate transport system permease small subunit